MRHFYFILGIHGHQPVGNFDKVLEQAYQLAYRPFFQVLSRHPQIKFVFHSCGYLLEWIERQHLELFDTIRTLMQRGQMEILGGGYYEPVLAAIPPEDGIAQVRQLSHYIESRFDYRPQGMWLAERVWEPFMPSIIAPSGMRYALVDDCHFAAAGKSYEELRGYFSAEHQGHVIALFPISEKLRYMQPFYMPQENIDLFRSVASDEGMPLLVMMDDAEKFGAWPGTHDWVYKQRWLENFLEALEQNCDWLHTVTFSEFMRDCVPLAPAYLPSGSYFEMGGWALPPVAAQELEQLMDLLRSTGNAERFKPFVKGGNWLNYFVKYPESNHLHKRALHISRQYQARASDGQVQQEDWYCRGLEALHRAQCNDGYWHGVFGGLYMAHLRHAICQNLVEAELLLERSSHALPTWSTIETGDLDCDLKTEVLLSTDKLSAFLDPAEGGAVYELNFKPRLFNVVNTLARRPESYHRKIPLAAPHSPEASFAESEGPHDSNKVRSCSTQELQQHDYGRRGLFQDQLLLPSTEFAEYRQWNLPTADGFFLEQYELQLEQKTALLSRCHCWHLNPEYSLLAHYKNVRMAEAGMLECQHRWICKEGKVAANHLCALNFSFLTDGDPQKFMAFNGEWNRLGLSWTGSRLDVRTLELADGWAGFHLVIQFEPACCIWTFPVKTISQSEGGYEQNYQCSFFGVLWPLRLESGQESHSQITIAAEEWSS